MMARTALVCVLLLMPALGRPCGPYFDNAHHGFEEGLLCSHLEDLYLGLHGLAANRYELRQRIQAAWNEAEKAEAAKSWSLAREAWQRCLPGLDRQRLRPVRDRIDLLPLVGTTITATEWRNYRMALDHGKPEDLERFTVGAKPVLVAAARTSLAWAALQEGRVEAAVQQLDAAVRIAPASIKSDEIDFLHAIAPVFAGIKRGGSIAAPREALEGIAAWMAGHPHSPWLCHARGWQAYVLYHHRSVAWKGDNDGLHAAVRIWQSLLDDVPSRELFIPAVESLRLAYRRLRPTPPAWMVADPRHAVAVVWHAITDRLPEEADRIAMLAIGEQQVLALPDERLAGPVLQALAETWYRVGRRAAALDLADRAFKRNPTVSSRALLIRLNIDQGRPETAETLMTGMAIDRPELVGDALRRLGGAWEKKREWAKALAAYTRANSTLDVFILTDGEMPLDHFLSLVRTATACTSSIAEPGGWGTDNREAGYEWLPELRHRLGRRLVRAGRVAEALEFLDPPCRALAERLLELNRDLDAAPPAQRADRLHDLANFWYDEGKKLVFNDRYWHQWAFGLYAPPDQAGGEPSPEQLSERRRCIAELESMTVYLKALPLFLEIADRYADHPRAPEALFKAAHCRYWLCGQSYLKTCRYWLEQSRREDFWGQGDALLRRLAERYPQHALASDAKVRRAVRGERPERLR
jgi:tetratricopeptide (TPR) repeat protein